MPNKKKAPRRRRPSQQCPQPFELSDADKLRLAKELKLLILMNFLAGRLAAQADGDAPFPVLDDYLVKQVLEYPTLSRLRWGTFLYRFIAIDAC